MQPLQTLAKKNPIIAGVLAIVIGCCSICSFCTGASVVMDRLGMLPSRTPTSPPTETLPPSRTPLPTATLPPTETLALTETPLPTLTFTPLPTKTPYITATLPAGCYPQYPDFCISKTEPRKTCDDLPKNFTVLPGDPLGYDKDGDGTGCEKN